MGKNFSRVTKGVNGQGFVSRPTAYTTQATYTLFQQNAALGEIGVYDANESRRSSAIGVNESIFIAQKMTNGIKRTPLIPFRNILARRRNYLAPANCQWFLGYRANGTLGGGSLNLPNTPSAGRQYEFAVLEVTEGYDPLPTFNYTYTAKANQNQLDIMLEFAKMINDVTNLQYRGIDRLVTAQVTGNGTLANFTAGGTTPTLTFTRGSAVATLGGTTPTINAAVGDYVVSTDGSAGITDIVQTNIYRVIAVSAGVSITLDRPFEEVTRTLAAAQMNGTGAAGGSIRRLTAPTAAGLRLTGIDFEDNFRIAIREELEFADINQQQYTIGNGFYDHVVELEREIDTYEGGTTKNTVFDEFFGRQDRFAISNGVSETYDMFNLDYTLDSNLVGPTNGTTRGTITLVLARSAGGLTATFNTLLGL